MGIGLNRRGLLNAPVAVFRVDAGPGIGMGHFMRCRTLAIEMLKRNWVVYFVGSGLPAELSRSKTVSSTINYIPFPAQTSSSQDVRQFIELVRARFDRQINYIVFDSYRFNRDDYARLQLFGGRVPVAVIDDLAEHDTPAQVVINPNPMFSPEPYERQKIPCILCGQQYTLVRPEIIALREREYNPAGPVLVSLGGGDVVEPMMKVLNSLPENLENDVIVSVSENCPLDQIQAWVDANPQKRIINNRTDKFPRLLSQASLAITGGGGTLWEVYCLGIPSLSVIWVDNQRNASVIIKDQATSFLVDLISNINIELQSETLENGLQKIVETFGPPGKTRAAHETGYRTAEVISREQTSLAIDGADAIDSRFMRKAISRLTSGCGFPQEMIQRQRQLIDGLGARRVVEALEGQGWQDVELLASDYRRSYEDW
ncbi:MAG: UDP-2,4-diacetamido-2,4,6-trideoxy-beta-L-altropyranose hydrolase [Candidatus Riflebacteria bacterium]